MAIIKAADTVKNVTRITLEIRDGHIYVSSDHKCAEHINASSYVYAENALTKVARMLDVDFTGGGGVVIQLNGLSQEMIEDGRREGYTQGGNVDLGD